MIRVTGISKRGKNRHCFGRSCRSHEKMEFGLNQNYRDVTDLFLPAMDTYHRFDWIYVRKEVMTVLAVFFPLEFLPTEKL